MNEAEISDWVVYPQEKWEQITPAQAGFDAVKFDSIGGDSHVEGARWKGEVHEEKEWGAVLTRGGYLVQVWGARPTNIKRHLSARHLVAHWLGLLWRQA